MFNKVKSLSQTWKRKKNRPHESKNEAPHCTDSLENSRLAPSRLNQTIATPSIMISPSNQQSQVADLTVDAPPRLVEQPNLAVDHVASTSVASLHSANTLDCYRMAARTPSPRPERSILQDPSAGTKSHNTQDEDIRGGSFSGAHNFTIVNAYMNDGGRTEKDWRTEGERMARGEEREEKALKQLAEKAMPGAMLDSKDRGYIPRCNEDTRQALRDRIVRWGRDDEETRRLLWLSGPAGVGKSAIAQTVAEELEKEGLLGAVFFFSRPNDRSDPDAVIPTLVYQLALLHSEYRRIITQRLITDPLILTRSRRYQLKELVVGPFLTLTFHRPLLIVLDGLDECKDRSAQCEFVEMISYHVQKEKSLRLRWVICSRPEPDLKVSFSSKDCKAICLEVKIEIDDSEAQQDSMRILKTGFADIRRRYSDLVTGDWPTNDQVRIIANRASGHLGFASFIIRFIGDKDYDDPSGQLDVCLKFLEHTSSSTYVNPLLALDLLYTQILSDIPTNILPTTRRILALYIFYDNRHLTAAAHANFLGLDQATFYRSLRRLHSVVAVPPASSASTMSIQIYHASFSDYLRDPARSGKFFLEEGVVPYLEIAISGLKWMGYGHKEISKRVEPELIWIPFEGSREDVLFSLCSFSFKPCWKACPKVPEDSLATLFESLENFDFHLDYSSRWTETEDFAYFIRWLATSGSQHKTLVVAATDSHETVIGIWHKDNPDTFFLPFSAFLVEKSSSGASTLHFRIGKNNPTQLSLKVAPFYGAGYG